MMPLPACRRCTGSLPEARGKPAFYVPRPCRKICTYAPNLLTLHLESGGSIILAAAAGHHRRKVMTTLQRNASRGTTSTPPRHSSAAEGKECLDGEAPEVKHPFTSYPPDCQDIAIGAQDCFFESTPEALLPAFTLQLARLGDSAAARSYAKALTSLRTFLATFQLIYEPLSTRTIADWLISLSLSGHTLSTLRLYLNGISSLHRSAVAEGAAPSALPDYPALRARLADIEAARKCDSASTDARRHASPLRPADDTIPADEMIPAPLLRDLHKAAVIAGGISMEAAARLRRDDLPAYPAELADIAAAYADPRRRYLFPLRQSAYTPRRMARRIARSVENCGDAALRQAPAPAMEWFLTALRCGATPSEALLTSGRNPMRHTTEADIFTLLDAAAPAEAPDSEAPDRLRRLVAEAVAADPLRWYALRLRRGTDIAGLRERIDRIASDRDSGALSPADTFYPMRPVAHRTAHGIRHGEEALIPDVLFIRIRLSRLQPLLARIADLAWCYRHPSGRGYARIPDCEMQAFQLAIGIFTPETDVRPLGTIPPRPGQQVVVIGGPFAGRTGRYLASVTPSAPAAVSAPDTPDTTDTQPTLPPPQPNPKPHNKPPHHPHAYDYHA